MNILFSFSCSFINVLFWWGIIAKNSIIALYSRSIDRSCIPWVFSRATGNFNASIPKYLVFLAPSVAPTYLGCHPISSIFKHFTFPWQWQFIYSGIPCIPRFIDRSRIPSLMAFNLYTPEYLVFPASSIVHASLGCPWQFQFIYLAPCIPRFIDRSCIPPDVLSCPWQFNLCTPGYLVFPAPLVAHASLGRSLMPLAISIYLPPEYIVFPAPLVGSHSLDVLSYPRFSISHLRLIPDHLIPSTPK